MMDSSKFNEIEARQEKSELRPKEGDGEDEEESNRAEPESDELQRLKQALAVSKQALAVSKQALADSKQALAVSEQARAASEQKIESKSVKYLLDNMPIMDVNPACKPSIIDNEKAHEIIQKFRTDMLTWKREMKALEGEAKEGVEDAEERLNKLRKKKPERFKFHEPAKIVRDKQPFAKYLKDFDLNFRDRDGDFIRSGLLLKLPARKPNLKHHNKTSPQIYLQDGILDIIRCYGLDADVIMEATLFSLRPDLVVVLYEGRLLFLVDVKNPSAAVFKAETAAGQSLDDCFVLKQGGMDQPFVLISTYNESVIARFDEDDEAYHKHLSEGLKKLKSLSLGEVRHDKNKDNDQEKPPISPTKPHLTELQLCSLSTNRNSKGGEEDAMEVDDDDCSGVEDTMDVEGQGYNYGGRAITFSEIFEVQDLYKVLALLLASSLASADASKESVKLLVPKEGTQLSGKELCTLYEDCFSFQKVNGTVSYNKPPQFRDGQKFHVLCTLGQGSTGRCILCTSSTCKMFAAKLFLLQPSTKYLEADRKEEIMAEFEVKWGHAENELKRWLQYVPNCRKYCKVVKMNGTPALTMPFFPPVPMGKREDALNLISACLKKIAEPNEGERYVYGEIQWRHFGCRWSEQDEMEITPLDLGSLIKASSLEEVRKGEMSVDEIIDSQIVSLRKRMGTEPIPDPKQTFVR